MSYPTCPPLLPAIQPTPTSIQPVQPVQPVQPPQPPRNASPHATSSYNLRSKLPSSLPKLPDKSPQRRCNSFRPPLRPHVEVAPRRPRLPPQTCARRNKSLPQPRRNRRSTQVADACPAAASAALLPVHTRRRTRLEQDAVSAQSGGSLLWDSGLGEGGEISMGTTRCEQRGTSKFCAGTGAAGRRLPGRARC